MKIFAALLIVIFFHLHCTSNAARKKGSLALQAPPAKNYDTTTKTIHVLVALCDNKYQGIVPVPAKIGNGQDPDNNLYWGCGYGVRTYFKKSSHWIFIRRVKVNDTLMERLVFKHCKSNYYLVADAYNGKFIKDCTVEFFNYCAGIGKDTMQIKGKTIGTGGNASLVAYTGHDGLMDFSLDQNFANSDGKKRDAVMLACISKKYFAAHMKKTKAYPLLWSTGLMSPEAYTLHDALEAYISGSDVRLAAAKAYSTYQKCRVKAAKNLLVTGW
ncbi:MAG TPA: hypothetical protein PLZ68_07470 [Ferruginibacter sp.]|nr:hypothetical protein [Ferruginibacter sp.]